MKTCTFTALLGAVAIAGIAQAAPNINSAVINPRVFNDTPGSTLVTVDSYPSLVSISDTNLTNGFANLHVWRVSENDTTPAQFQNADSSSLFADVTISTVGEGGLQLSPWWSPNVDGRFNLRTTDGEVACFGGRLPFYSFTASQGVLYTAGTTVRLGIEYDARSRTMADPAAIRYWYNGLNSGWLTFDQGNPAEDPPRGLWGALNPHQIGGYVQLFTAGGGGVGTFENISFIPNPSTLALLGLGGLVASRRRR